MSSIFGVIIWLIIIASIVGKAKKTSNMQKTKMQGHQSASTMANTVVPEMQKMPQTQQVPRNQQMARMQQGDIVTRAKQNAFGYSADTTMEELEAMHGHSARELSTGVLEYQAEQKKAHPHDASHIAAELDENEGALLGTVEDLMIKGYDGKLPYERDFLGEGMDMISMFSYQ